MAYVSNQGGVGVGTPQLKGILKKPSSPVAPESGVTFAAGRPTMTTDLRALMSQMAQGSEFSRGSTAHDRAAQDETQRSRSISATANTASRRKSLVAQRSSSGGKCESCRKPVKEFESVILKNCQRHEVCDDCVSVAINDSLKFNVIPVCPVESCHAVLTADEIQAYRRRARVKSSKVEEDGQEGDEEEDDSENDSENDTEEDSEEDSVDGSGDEDNEDDEDNLEEDDEGGENDLVPEGSVGYAVHESGKTPMSSTHDDSEEIFDEQVRAPVIKVRCDNCNRLVTGLQCLNVRKCKKKHMVCFSCVRATMNVSRTLVRCPVYRECKSMMSRDEVMQVKYDATDDDAKNAASHRESKSKAKRRTTVDNLRPALIYPDGLPHGDLWPVLMETQCSRCNRDIGVLNGIVLKQCNTHNVCVSCVRKSMTARASAVKCPMFPSCKALMLEDEVEAFVDRFGGPPTQRTSSA